MEELQIPKRISTTILNSLTGGVVPRIGLEYITVGRKNEVDAILNDINNIEQEGASFRFIVGKYGSGKSFLLQLIRSHAMEKGLVVLDVDLSPERRFVGNKGQGLATYRELIKNMSTKTKPDGGALTLIIEKWLSGIQLIVMQENNISSDNPKFLSLVKIKIGQVINDLEGMVHGFDFARILSMYLEAYINGEDEKKSYLLKWLRGEYGTKTEAKREIDINTIVNDDNWYDYLKILSQFVVHAGYKGMIIIIDELVNLYKIPQSISRQYNYEKILTMFNDTMQGKAKNLGIILAGTPQCIEDTRKGIFSYEALKSRLQEGKFNNGIKDMLGPIIRLKTLTYEELFVLIEKLKQIHEHHYGYKGNLQHDDMIFFMKMEFERIGANENITPREVIRDFLEILNILYQNPDLKVADIINGNDFKFSNSEDSDDTIHQEFAEFEL
ncbi:MAG: ATP-binding protein [Oscillospiraceae bacterium]|nr:ATP-binding protein [Oscillospiraceae bacterium]